MNRLKNPAQGCYGSALEAWNIMKVRKAQLWVLAITAALLGTVQVVVHPPILLAERFVPHAGWAEIAILSLYAAWLFGKMENRRRTGTWRRRVWGLFSAVFFLQAGLGLVGVDRFLMTGQLHLPVPAMIIAVPLYRGGGLFMPILFLVAVVLVGPAWCSYLCYIGAWDSAFATIERKPRALPRWRRWVRFLIFAGVVVTALVLRAASVGPATAAWFGAAFGLVGVGLMVGWSRRAGVMTHCVTWCPMSIVATAVGRLSPFRIRIRKETCTLCLACTTACRYDALSADDVRQGRPGFSCTLCGDCLASCRDRALVYRFPGLSDEGARRLFLVLVVSLHAVFLGLARL